MPRAASYPPATVPQFGVIEGGLLDGWSFCLLGVVVDGSRVEFDVKVTKPKWPFPYHTPVTLGRGDFKRLRNPGETALNHDTQRLIEAARAAQT